MTLNTGIKKEAISALIMLAKKYKVDKLILFGSRARGDYHQTSDIDLAVAGGDVIRFSVDVEDAVPTLLKFDVVNLDGSVQCELRKSIEKEGILLYEKV